MWVVEASIGADKEVVRFHFESKPGEDYAVEEGCVWFIEGHDGKRVALLLAGLNYYSVENMETTANHAPA